MTLPRISVECLGQSGFRLALGRLSVFIDPYLSDRVASLEGRDLQRMVPAPYEPDEAPAADWILVTHVHDDHCDPDTLGPLCARSPQVRIVCPAEVMAHVAALGIGEGRTIIAEESWLTLDSETRVHAVTAVHTEPVRDKSGRLCCVGYVIEHQGRRIYHSGDTRPDAAIFSSLEELRPLDVAFLPVNERNYYRDGRGIIGNMSVREAFQMAADLGVTTLVPMHWDLFAPNSVPREELALLYELLRPPFRLVLNPASV